MIIEIATAAAMYWSDRALAADTDIPVMKPRVESCSRYHDNDKIKACLDAKMKLLQQPDGDMWDTDWVSAVQPTVEDVGSAKAANPKSGHSKAPVAKKPHS